MPYSAECQPLAQQLDAIEAEIAGLDSDFNAAGTGPARAAHARALARLHASADRVRKNLEECALQHPWVPPPPPDTFSWRRELRRLNGWAQLEVNRNGTVTFSGHVHNDPAISEAFDFTVRLVVGGRHLIVTQKSGHCGGTGASREERNVLWSETNLNPDVAFHYDEIVQANSLQVIEEQHGSITGPLESLGEFVLGSVVGISLLPVASVIFVGVEAYSVISRNWAASEILDGTLWMLGPTGAAYSFVAHAVNALATNRRALTAEEWRFANEEVFAGTLPATITITDAAGLDGDPFTFPEFAGGITLNLGPLWKHPIAPVPAHVRPSTVFIHELVHAWQIKHCPLGLSWMCNALAIQACRLTEEGKDIYVLPEPGPPFANFNIEEQAVIVESWFRGDPTKNIPESDKTSPYYRYILGNIQAGAW
jgi:hypothetical protein